jgi:hypothetical protein
MRILTANRLSDGAVVYYQGNKIWSHWIDSAFAFASVDEAERCLADVTRSGTDVVGAYVIPVEQVTGRLCPTSMREKLRAQGPTLGPSIPSNFKGAEKLKTRRKETNHVPI